MHGSVTPVAVTGRFQPFHCGHLDLLRIALQRAPRVIIAITHPDGAPRVAHGTSAHRHLESSNPFSHAQRCAMIEAALQRLPEFEQRYELRSCDLENPASWAQVFPAGTVQLVRVFSDWEQEKARRLRAAGQTVEVLIGDSAARICASDIRAAWQRGCEWAHWVPDGTREWLQDWQRRAA